MMVMSKAQKYAQPFGLAVTDVNVAVCAGVPGLVSASKATNPGTSRQRKGDGGQIQ